MADNVTLPGTGAVVATDDAGAAGHVQLVKLARSADGSAVALQADADGVLVNLGANNDVVVSGTVTATGPVTNAELRAAAVPVSGPVTNAELRATAVSVTDVGTSTSGTIAALNGAVTLAVAGDSGAVIDLRGTFVATVTFQGTIDGTNWIATPATPVGSVGNVATVTTATAAGAWYVQCQGFASVRAIATAYTSGTITANIRSSAAPNVVYVVPVGASQAMTIASGTVTTVSTVAAATPATPTANVLNSAATTNATVVKATAGTLYGISASNINAAARYLKLYNLGTSPVVGTTVPVLTLAIPPGGHINFNFGPMGHRFTVGIGLALTTGNADNDTGAVAANEIKVITSYI